MKKQKPIKKQNKVSTKRTPTKSVSKKPNNKNISTKIPNGRTIQSRDEFLKDGVNTKIKHPNANDLFRKLLVVDSNRDDELAIIKLSTKGRHKLENYQQGKSTYNAYVVIEDNLGNAIKIDGVKFKENKPSKDVSKKDVNKIKKKLLVDKETSKKLRKENRQKLHKLKKRK